MANQTELLNVSNEMKLNDKRQIIEGQEHDEELCFSSSDTTDELYSSSAPDTCGDSLLAKQETLILCGLAGVHIVENTGHMPGIMMMEKLMDVLTDLAKII